MNMANVADLPKPNERIICLFYLLAFSCALL